MPSIYFDLILSAQAEHRRPAVNQGKRRGVTKSPRRAPRRNRRKR